MVNSASEKCDWGSLGLHALWSGASCPVDWGMIPLSVSIIKVRIEPLAIAGVTGGNVRFKDTVLFEILSKEHVTAEHHSLSVHQSSQPG